MVSLKRFSFCLKIFPRVLILIGGISGQKSIEEFEISSPAHGSLADGDDPLFDADEIVVTSVLFRF